MSPALLIALAAIAGWVYVSVAAPDVEADWLMVIAIIAGLCLL